jgi:cation/acetate symporter
VQIIKAVLLLGGATILVLMVLWQFDMNPVKLFAAAQAKYGTQVLSPGGLVSNPWDAVSLGLALMFGTAGLPHILMRFYTVPDAKAARKSVFVATGFIAFFYILTFIIGFGAMVLVGQDVISGMDKGGNMAALLMSITWRKFSTFGAVCSIVTGTTLAVVLIIFSPTVWVDILKNPAAVFPLKNPALISITGAFLAGYIGSMLKGDPEAEARYPEQKVRNYLGVSLD